MDILQLATLTRNIILACKEGNLEKLKELITPENVNFVFDDCNHLWGTPLFLLTRLRHDEKAISCVEFLLSMGANVNWSFHEGDTALFNTTVPGVARLLIKAGSDINSKNSHGLTPLEDIYQRPDVDSDEIYYEQADFELAKCFIDLGAHISDNECPQWIKSLDRRRKLCKTMVITVLGIRRFRKSPVIGSNGRDVMGLIAKDIWSTRYRKTWIGGAE